MEWREREDADCRCLVQGNRARHGRLSERKKCRGRPRPAPPEGDWRSAQTIYVTLQTAVARAAGPAQDRQSRTRGCVYIQQLQLGPEKPPQSPHSLLFALCRSSIPHSGHPLHAALQGQTLVVFPPFVSTLTLACQPALATPRRMAHRFLTSTPLLARTSQTLAARARAAVPAQYANYVTASAVVMAGGKARKGTR